MSRSDNAPAKKNRHDMRVHQAPRRRKKLMGAPATLLTQTFVALPLEA
jgi:hypothetical protein